MTPKHTLIYPQKQDAGRAQSRPPGATMGGPVPNGPRSQARASSGPCPASLTALPLEEDPRPSRAEAGKSLDFLDFRIYPKPIPRDLSQDFSIFPDRIPVGFYPWSRSYLGPAYARIAGASTSFPVPPEGPDSGGRVSPLCVSDPPQGGPIGCSPPHAPPEGSFHVWPWGSLDTHPRGLSHATPLGGCCVTGHDPSPAHAGGSCHS